MDLAVGNDLVNRHKEDADNEGMAMILISAQVEAELVDFDAEDRVNFFESLDM